MESRKPSSDELRLIEFLIQVAQIKMPKDWKIKLTVETTNDGGMGSLVLSMKGFKEQPRQFGKQISECSFTDLDGIKVIASLYVDQNGELYELDIWKVNYSPLLKIPNTFNCEK